ncbi:MAG: sugar phosphate isomerase/epimerase family protein [Desulfobacterales bacterium]
MNRIGIVHNYWGTDFTANPDLYCSRISRAASIGFNLLTVQMDAIFYAKDDKQRLLDTAEKEDVKLNYSGGMGPNMDICSESAEDRERGIAHMQNAARLIADMQEGAEFAGAITGVFRDELKGRSREKCWENSVNSMKEIIKAAEDGGVIFSLEVLNRFEHFLINTCDEALRYVEAVGSPNLKILLDTYHMNIEEDSIGEAIVKGGDKIGLFHVGENNRNVPGRGHIPWDEVVGALKQIDYQGDTVMEPVVLAGGATGGSMAIHRDLTGGKDLDDLAREGLEFYKGKLASV